MERQERSEGHRRAMDDRGTVEGPERAGRGVGEAFDLAASKLLRPLVRPGTVRRSVLLDRLANGDGRRLVSVAAPAGYGKTTLLSQWAARGGQAFAWVSVEEPDNDPKVLLTYVAEALDAVEPIGGRVFDALTSPGSSVLGSVVPRLGSAFSVMTKPVVLVLDDVHMLRNQECRAALSVLADHVPAGHGWYWPAGPNHRCASRDSEPRAGFWRSAPVSSRSPRPRHRPCCVARASCWANSDVAELHQRTEGWPAGLYLAALYLREGGAVASAAVSFGGADRLVSEYMESEFLARISSRQRVFLTRTAVLERMSGPLCDAVLELPGSATILADLERSNLLLVPLDRRGHWYRYHHLFRDMLLSQLDRQEPDLMAVLRRRAASWCLRNDLPEDALEYSIAAGDVDTAAGLVERLGVPTHRQGRFATLERWFRWLEDRGGIEGHPMVAVLAALFSALTGRPAEAERWADVVDRWQYGGAMRPDHPQAEAYAAILRALMCRRGVEQICADADEAVRRCAGERIVTPAPALYQGLGRVLSGDLDGGDASFEAAVSEGEEAGAHETLAVTLCERSLIAMARGQWDEAEVLAGQARAVLRRAGIEESYATPLVCAVHARAAIRRQDVAAARHELVRAQRLRPLLTYAMPQLAVQARIELTRVHLALADVAGARTLVQEVNELLGRRPGLGTLVGEARSLQDRLSDERDGSHPGASSLTTAELRVLPLLATHMSFPEIAEQLFLSPHTIKSQAVSIYRKLGASSRSQAVTYSRELGLLEG